MGEKIKIDDFLSNRNGDLFLDELSASQLIKRYGSPLFVVSENQIRRNVREFQEAFSKNWTDGEVKILPAVKANWNLAVQHILGQEGCGADVYSPGELEIALRAGIRPEFISVNGCPKSFEHVKRTLEVGARLTIDSMEEIEFLEILSPILKSKAQVRLRIRSATGYFKSTDFIAEGPMPTEIAALGYKSGLSVDEVIEAGKRLLKLKNIEIVGFHQHHGRHRPTVDWWEAQMKTYARDIAKVCKNLGGLAPKEIDIGGGYAIPRDPHAHAIDRTAGILYSALYVLNLVLRIFSDSVRYRIISFLTGIMKTTPNKTKAPAIEDYAKVITSTLKRELNANGVNTKGVMLQLEPGRRIHGNAGIHLTTIKSVKRQERPLKWNIVATDTSEFFLAAGRFEFHMHDYRVANKLNHPKNFFADVTGRSCYADRLLSNVALPEVAAGDIFAFLDTGAYQEASSSNFNAMPRPATVLVKGDTSHLIKRGESQEDVFAREIIPERFQVPIRSEVRLGNDNAEHLFSFD